MIAMNETPRVEWQIEAPIPPSKEWVVREIFVLFHRELGYRILRTQEAFPDYILSDKEGGKIRAEAEINARDFVAHGHPLEDCDLIICWEDNWKECKKPRLELSKYVLATFPRFEQEELQGVSDHLKQYRKLIELLSKIDRLLDDVDRFVRKRNSKVKIGRYGGYWKTLYESQYSYENWALPDHASVEIDFGEETVSFSGAFEPAKIKRKLDMQGWREVLDKLEKENYSFWRQSSGVETAEELDKGIVLKELEDPDKIDYVYFSRVESLEWLCRDPADIVESLGIGVLWALNFLKEEELYTPSAQL